MNPKENETFLGKKQKKENSNEDNSVDDDNSKIFDENGDYRTGRWEKVEHLKFLKGCLLHGNNWKKVKDFVKTRSSAQIRSHAQKYIIKLCKKYNVQDSKHLKNFKNFRKSGRNDYLNSLSLDLNDTAEDLSDIKNMETKKIEETILAIFKSYGSYNGNKDENFELNNQSQKYDSEDSRSKTNNYKEKIFGTSKIGRLEKKENGEKINNTFMKENSETQFFNDQQKFLEIIAAQQSLNGRHQFENMNQKERNLLLKLINENIPTNVFMQQNQPINFNNDMNSIRLCDELLKILNNRNLNNLSYNNNKFSNLNNYFQNSNNYLNNNNNNFNLHSGINLFPLMNNSINMPHTKNISPNINYISNNVLNDLNFLNSLVAENGNKINLNYENQDFNKNNNFQKNEANVNQNNLLHLLSHKNNKVDEFPNINENLIMNLLTGNSNNLNSNPFQINTSNINHSFSNPLYHYLQNHQFGNINIMNGQNNNNNFTLNSNNIININNNNEAQIYDKDKNIKNTNMESNNAFRNINHLNLNNLISPLNLPFYSPFYNQLNSLNSIEVSNYKSDPFKKSNIIDKIQNEIIHSSNKDLKNENNNNNSSLNKNENSKIDSVNREEINVHTIINNFEKDPILSASEKIHKPNMNDYSNIQNLQLINEILQTLPVDNKDYLNINNFNSMYNIKNINKKSFKEEEVKVYEKEEKHTEFSNGEQKIIETKENQLSPNEIKLYEMINNDQNLTKIIKILNECSENNSEISSYNQFNGLELNDILRIFQNSFENKFNDSNEDINSNKNELENLILKSIEFLPNTILEKDKTFDSLKQMFNCKNININEYDKSSLLPESTNGQYINLQLNSVYPSNMNENINETSNGCNDIKAKDNKDLDCLNKDPSQVLFNKFNQNDIADLNFTNFYNNDDMQSYISKLSYNNNKNNNQNQIEKNIYNTNLNVINPSENYSENKYNINNEQNFELIQELFKRLKKDNDTNIFTYSKDINNN